MGDAAAYAYISMAQAIEDAGLNEEQVSNERTGLLVGSGGGSSKWQVEAADILREKGVKRVGPYMVPRTMASTTSACLATPFKLKVLTTQLVLLVQHLHTVLVMRLSKFNLASKM